MLLFVLTILDQTGPKRVDLDSHSEFQQVIDHEPGQYLGHTSLLSLDGGKTLLLAYPKGHGKGPIVLRRSTDAGKSWSPRIKTPPNWETSLETPTLFELQGRLIIWSGLYPARQATSDDKGVTWTNLEAVGEWGGIVLMSSLVKSGQGRATAYFHDDGRFFRSEPESETRFTLYCTDTLDAGKTWSFPRAIYADASLQLCEPGAILSPERRTIALLLRENSRKHPSQLMVSNDGGRAWSLPRSLPNWLCGDRHTAVYLPDGRLFVSYRFMPPDDPWKGDWVAWVGHWEDLMNNRPGDALVRLKDNEEGSDCAYPGLAILPNGSLYAVTYGHWTVGEEPYILSVTLPLNVLPS
ncbi:MAG: exo-alpha-sialidase [Chthonomonadaceae bacterium]|nr:exo-alpha-sialidase [Chthonomonadaceae bacterium]